MSANMKRIVALVLAMACMLTALTGCAKKEEKPSDPQPVAKDSIIYALNGDITTLDPLQITDGASATIWFQLYDTLFVEADNGEVVPNLVDKYSWNEDGTELTLTLKKGIKFHSGDELKAEDVVFMCETIFANPTLTSTLTNYAGAELVDEYTAKIKYSSAFGAALRQLCGYSTNIVNKSAYEADPAKFADNPDGTGAYKFVSRQAGESIVLVANEDYFKGAPAIKNITFKIITDPTAASLALQNGDIDFLQTPSIDQKDAIENSGKAKWYSAGSATSVFLMINNADPILSNEKVRQAIWYAIDKDLLVEGALDGYGEVLETLAPTAVASAYDKDFKGLGYDVEKAKALLAEAGYPDGVTLKITTMSGSDTYVKPTTVLQDMLKKAGINLEIDYYERSAWIAKIGGGDYAFCVMTWGVPGLDGDFYWRLLISGSYLQINSEELDNLLKKSRVTLDQKERHEIFNQINTLVRDHANLVPLYTNMNHVATNKDLVFKGANASTEYHVADMHW